jgi:hypothetical protein
MRAGVNTPDESGERVGGEGGGAYGKQEVVVDRLSLFGPCSYTAVVVFSLSLHLALALVDKLSLVMLYISCRKANQNRYYSP